MAERSPSSSRSSGAVLVLFFAVLMPLPLLLGPYHVHVLTGAVIFAIAALALQLLLGVTGLLSLGQAAFLGIGAYASALVTTSVGLSFEIGVLAAGVISGVPSQLLVPILPLRGGALGVATVGLPFSPHFVI